eukprot:COSAG02_NODE_1457_length_12507_cov_7.416989_7_plen_34_part_00
MDRIADAANEQVAQRDTARTFEAGLASDKADGS